MTYDEFWTAVFGTAWKPWSYWDMRRQDILQYGAEAWVSREVRHLGIEVSDAYQERMVGDIRLGLF